MRTWTSVKPSRLVLVVGLLTALLTTSARAGGPPSYEPPYRIDYRPPDQARARAVVLRRADLPSNRRWYDGEITLPTILMPLGCPSVPSSRPYPVLTGAADAEWETGGGYPEGGTNVESQVRVLAIPAMARRDTRSLRSPESVVRCLKASLAHGLKGLSPCRRGEFCTLADHLISLGTIAFPRVAPLTLALQFVERYKQMRGTHVLRVYHNAVKYVVVVKGRTEIVLIVSGQPRAIGDGLVARLARTLAARATA
jgi:hypothetical protein